MIPNDFKFIKSFFIDIYIFFVIILKTVNKLFKKIPNMGSSSTKLY
jgi:hypothetical protein